MLSYKAVNGIHDAKTNWLIIFSRHKGQTYVFAEKLIASSHSFVCYKMKEKGLKCDKNMINLSFGVGVWSGRYSTLLLIFHASYFLTTLPPCLHLDCVRSNLETCAKNRVPSQWPMHQAAAAGLPSNSLLCYFTASKQAFFLLKEDDFVLKPYCDKGVCAW